MTHWSPAGLVAGLGTGILAFPVTPFDAELGVDLPSFGRNLEVHLQHSVAAVVPGAGTGEGFSLTQEESRRLLQETVRLTPDDTPVIAPALGGIGPALQYVEAAEQADADALLLFPPYLIAGGQQGLIDHVSTVCRATTLPVIVYNRANGQLKASSVEQLAEAHPNFIGVKDGVGDLDLLNRLSSRVGDRLVLIGGIPTAELSAVPFRNYGIASYSSALFNFIPDFALTFHGDVSRRDDAAIRQKMTKFLIPYLDLRDRQPGYAVSIVKSGMRIIGLDSGGVRPPLTDLTEHEEEELARLIKVAHGLASPKPATAGPQVTSP